MKLSFQTADRIKLSKKSIRTPRKDFCKIIKIFSVILLTFLVSCSPKKEEKSKERVQEFAHIKEEKAKELARIKEEKARVRREMKRQFLNGNLLFVQGCKQLNYNYFKSEVYLNSMGTSINNYFSKQRVNEFSDYFYGLWDPLTKSDEDYKRLFASYIMSPKEYLLVQEHSALQYKISLLKSFRDLAENHDAYPFVEQLLNHENFWKMDRFNLWSTSWIEGKVLTKAKILSQGDKNLLRNNLFKSLKPDFKKSLYRTMTSMTTAMKNHTDLYEKKLKEKGFIERYYLDKIPFSTDKIYQKIDYLIAILQKRELSYRYCLEVFSEDYTYRNIADFADRYHGPVDIWKDKSQQFHRAQYEKDICPRATATERVQRYQNLSKKFNIQVEPDIARNVSEAIDAGFLTFDAACLVLAPETGGGSLVLIVIAEGANSIWQMSKEDEVVLNFKKALIKSQLNKFGKR